MEKIKTTCIVVDMDVYQRLFYERLSEIFLNEDITTTCRLMDMPKKMREATFRCVNMC